MFTTGSSLLTRSDLSAHTINALLNGHGKLQGLGKAFIDVEGRDGVNAFWGMAQAIEETGWGVSAIAEDKNNLFGITAYDSNPYGNASSYHSPADCVEYWGNFLKRHYLTPGGSYYVSATPAGVARHWASDPYYAAKIVNIMNLLLDRAPGTPEPPPVQGPTAPGANTYVVQPGDDLSTIAQKHSLTLSQLESLNPQAGHPAGTFSVLWAGDILNVGSGAPPSAAQYYTVQGGDTLSLIAEKHGLSLAEIEALNPQIGNPNLIFPGQSVRVS
ncbi:MAG TPA: LysM peptidoglycan-binding domain-containing protein [Streptosporangiaceae bacterium]|jgi:LysM repeat protein|nr:LysM peptidoglycan-binding domain-containing protein [Streptosporangiaceae bacterium]